jgi:hypothetical protein
MLVELCGATTTDEELASRLVAFVPVCAHKPSGVKLNVNIIRAYKFFILLITA